MEATGLNSSVKAYESRLLVRVGGSKAKHGFFTRKGGACVGLYSSLNMSFGKAGDSRENVFENFKRVAKWFGVDVSNIVTAHPVHSTNVVRVTKPFERNGPGSQPDAKPDADGLVTTERGLLLGVLAADCLPILVYYDKPEQPIIAAIHAGCQGALQGVLQNGLSRVKEIAGSSDTSRMYVSIGPSVRRPNFLVDDSLKALYLAQNAGHAQYFEASVADRNGWHVLDLVAYVKGILMDEKVPESNIDDLEMDTFSNPDEFFSRERAVLLNEGSFGNQISCILLC